MSSKSRKHSQPQRKKARRPEDDLAGQAAPAASTSSGQSTGQNPDEPSLQDFLESEIKTPEGKSPLVYASMILLLVFLLIVFLLPPGAFQNAGRQNPIVLSWEHPSAGTQALKSNEFTLEKRQFNELMQIFTGQRGRLEDEQVARMVIQDALAVEAGITVGDTELLDALVPLAEAMGGTQVYEQTINARFFGGVQPFEETVRRFLRLNKYEALVQGLATLPSRETIEELWSEEQEQRYLVARYMAEDFADAALAELPDAAGLEAWFQTLEDFRRDSYKRPEARGAAIAGVLLGDGAVPDETALLAAYPLPEDWDDATQAKIYYDSHFFARYERPEDEIPEPAEGETSQVNDRYYSFDEVVDQATREARLKAGLDAWYDDLAAREEAGETVELSAEAERLGLDYAAGDQALTRSEWTEEGGFNGRFLAGRLFVLGEAGNLTNGVTVGGQSMCIARLTEIVDPALPPFEELADELSDAWVEERKVDLAEAQAQALIAALEENYPREESAEEEDAEDLLATDPALIVSDAEAFEAATSTTGGELLVRDWLAPRASESDDPNYEEPANEFIRTRGFLFSAFEVGQVSEPLEDRADDSWYVVRLDGSRSMALERMKASDLQGFLTQSAFTQRAEFVSEGPFSLPVLREQYSLQLPEDLRPVEPEEGEEGDEEVAEN